MLFLLFSQKRIIYNFWKSQEELNLLQCHPLKKNVTKCKSPNITMGKMLLFCIYKIMQIISGINTGYKIANILSEYQISTLKSSARLQQQLIKPFCFHCCFLGKYNSNVCSRSLFVDHYVHLFSFLSLYGSWNFNIITIHIKSHCYKNMLFLQQLSWFVFLSLFLCWDSAEK